MVVRVAWFSPVPPSRSGIAAYTAEVVPLLRERLLSIDLFVDPTDVGAPFPTTASVTPERSPGTTAGHDPPRDSCTTAFLQPAFAAHEFVWRHRRQPYDLTVYQLGNAECHNYMWAYLFRYPGLVVLHDAQLHQSRALWLLKRLRPRREDYFAELAANHPDAPADLGELVAAGLGGLLYQQWPMLSLVLRTSRLTAVHHPRLAESLRESEPDSRITDIPMGVRDPIVASGSEGGTDSTRRAARARLRAGLGIPDDALVIAAYGGITPEKRIPQLLQSVAALGDRTPPLRVLLVGAPAGHYDVEADARRLGLDKRLHVAGYVSDEDLPAYLDAADVACCLRWPTNRETSASWLRCLAAGRPTVITRLAHLRDIPGDVAAAIDVLDEDTALPATLAELAEHADLRRAMGERARAYERVIAEAAARPVLRPSLPPHLLDDGSSALNALLAEMGIPRAYAALNPPSLARWLASYGATSPTEEPR
jgi:glycosyltransferase involved in cell wall biosynthesis